MIPKEKAKELLDKYRTYIRIADKYGYNLTDDEIYLSKQCAIITVDEILEIEYWQYMESGGKQEQIYWQEVKQEILAL